MKVKLIILIILLCMAITFIVADKYYWAPKLEPVQNYYIVTWDSEDLTYLKRQWRVVEILTSDLYRQRIISWTADSLLKELSR